jgi:hypothetical protein
MIEIKRGNGLWTKNGHCPSLMAGKVAKKQSKMPRDTRGIYFVCRMNPSCDKFA